jgi:predicted permease
MDRLRQDLRQAWRAWTRQPGVAALALATLALGIGANTAIFTVVNGILLKPLDYPQPGRIVAVMNEWKNGLRGSVSAPDFHDWHDTAQSFSAMAYYAGGDTSVSVHGAAEYGAIVPVSPGFFAVFGIAPQAGRVLSNAEERPGGAAAAVISYEFWQRRLGGRDDAIGTAVTFRQQPYTIVGVMPRGFAFPAGTDVWFPAATAPETTSRSAHNYRVVARLAPGVTLEQAQAEMRAIAARLSAAYPQSNENKSAAVVPLRDQIAGPARATLYLLFGAVLLVLLIACANVANLLLARATARSSELAVRAALGANRRRLASQLITESLLLSLAAGAAGIVAARWAVPALLAFAPSGLPRLDAVTLDWRVMTFALVASVAATVIFGVAPALQASRADLNATLRQSGRGMAPGGSRLRSALVVAEIALAVALVAGAALLVRSFLALGRADLGFNADRVLVAETSVPNRGGEDAPRAARFYGEVVPRIAGLAGVVSAAAVRGLPGTPFHSNGGYWLEGGPGPNETGVRSPQAVFTVVTPDYFRTMQIPLVDGRDFDGRDVDTAPMVAIVNRALARRAFGTENPIGHRIQSGLDTLAFMTIVGVVGDARVYDPSRAPLPEIFMPYRQHPNFATSMTIVARTSGEPLAAAHAIAGVVRQVNPAVPARVSTLEETLSTAVATPRFRTILVGAFAALALLLALAGVYGVMAYAVSRRTAEIGTRIALGASAGDIMRLVLGAGLRLAAGGTLAGVLLAWAMARLIRGLLFAVAPDDPLVLAGVPLLLVLVSLTACAVPAWRASRVDPMRALRAE